jgi:hypothetical protein
MSYIGATPTDIPLTSSDLADGLVTAAKLATDSVTTVKVVDDNVTTAKVLDNNVTLAKIADGTQGDILYYGASGAPTLLGFGTSGDFLKTQGTGANPAWASAGGGSMTYLATVTGTDVSGLSLDGYFTSAYDIYQIYFNGVGATNNTSTGFRFRSSDADLTTSNYRTVAAGHQNTGGVFGELSVIPWNANYIGVSSGDNTSDLSYPCCLEVTLYNPLATDRFKTINFQSVGYNSSAPPDGLIRSWLGSAHYHTAEDTALSGITVMYNGGNITGTVQMYGIKNS